MDSLQLGIFPEVIRPKKWRLVWVSVRLSRIVLPLFPKLRLEPELRFTSVDLSMATPLDLVENLSDYPANGEQRSVYDGTLRISWQSLNGGTGGSVDLPARLTSRFPFEKGAAIAGTIAARSPTPLLPGAVGAFSGSYSSVSPIQFTDPASFVVEDLTLIGYWWTYP